MIALCNNDILCSKNDLFKFQKLFNSYKSNLDDDGIEIFKKASMFLLAYIACRNRKTNNSMFYIDAENLFNSLIRFINGENPSLNLNDGFVAEHFDIIISMLNGTVDSALKENLNEYILIQLLSNIRVSPMTSINTL